MYRYVLGIVYLFTFTAIASADIYRYVDENDKEYFVNDILSVPEQYRDQLKVLIKDQPKTLQDTGKIKEQQNSRRKNKELDERIKERIAARKKAAKMRDIEVYVASWCPHCQKLEEFLKYQRIPYKRYDIDRDPSAKKRLKQLDPEKSIPLTKIGNKVITGNRPEMILEYLNK